MSPSRFEISSCFARNSSMCNSNTSAAKGSNIVLKILSKWKFNIVIAKKKIEKDGINHHVQKQVRLKNIEVPIDFEHQLIKKHPGAASNSKHRIVLHGFA